MPSFLLAKSTFFLMEWIAWLLQWIINGLYWLVTLMLQPQAMALTILLMTFVVRAAMTPLTIKQQKSSRKMQRLQPEIQKIQAKYKGKTDPDAQTKMQQELSAVYSRNNTSPLSGCLPLLIQMPILFALYEILRNIPFYVNGFGNAYDMENIFAQMAQMAQGVEGIDTIISSNFSSVVSVLTSFKNDDISTILTNQDFMVDFLYHLSGEQWTSFMNLTGLGNNAEFVRLFELQKEINTIGWGFLSFNLSDIPAVPWTKLEWSIVIPVLAGVLTFLQSFIVSYKTKLRNKAINPNYEEDQTQKSSKIMLIISPVMILIFGFQVPIGLSIYWIFSSLFAIISQEIVDVILDKQEVAEAIAKRQAYLERQNELGIGEGLRLTDPNKKNSKSSLAGNKQNRF